MRIPDLDMVSEKGSSGQAIDPENSLSLSSLAWCFLGAMAAEKVLLHRSNSKCKRWKRFFEPLSLDGLPMTCGLYGHKLVKGSVKPKKHQRNR